MVSILSPSGVELPDPGELFSRAQYNRNVTKTNDLWNNQVNYAKADRIMCFSPTATFAWGANTAWDAGPLAYDSSNFQNTAGANFCGPGSLSGTIKFLEVGVYTAVWVSLPQADPGSKSLVIQASGSWPGNPPSTHTKFGLAHRAADAKYWENVCIAERIKITQVNLEIRFQGQSTNAHNDWPVVRIHQVGK